MKSHEPEPFYEEEEPKPRHFPEFVLLEEEKGPFSEGFHKQFEQTFEGMQSKRFPTPFRLVFLVGALLLFTALAVATPLLFLFAFLNLLTFLQMKAFLAKTRFLWALYKKLWVVMIGLIIALFSPDLGIALVMAYFMLRGQKGDQNWVSHLLSARFYRG